jgi:hypothetical protein
VAVFNANICFEDGKVWWGDLDLTIDEAQLADLAAQTGLTTHVLYESDGRFSYEDAPELGRAVYSVTASGHTRFDHSHIERRGDGALYWRPVILALDNDPAGHAATAKAIDHAVGATQSPDIWVIDPDLYDTAKDPGDLVRARGIDAWRDASAAPVCGITWRALDLTGPLANSDRDLNRRAALATAGAWLGALPPRLAIEQTTALNHLADPQLRPCRRPTQLPSALLATHRQPNRTTRGDARAVAAETSRSSKPAGRRNSTVGRFDSCAAPLGRNRHG